MIKLDSVSEPKKARLQISDFTVCITISALVQALWCGLEMLIYGETQHRTVDDIMTVILTASLYFNYKQWRDNNA